MEADYNIHRKIFVGNISYRVKRTKLSKFFSKFGPVEHCYIVKDHIKKWSRGIGFVTFKDVESMNAALQATDEELVFDDRQMRVKPAELSNKTRFLHGDKIHSEEDESEEEAVEEDREKCGEDMKSCSTPNDNQFQMETDETDCKDIGAHEGTHIDQLFDELLIRIFSLLTVKERLRIEGVCHRWRYLAQRSWRGQKTLHFKNMFRRFGGVTDMILKSVLGRCGQYLEVLDLSASPRLLTDFSMDIIAKQCPDLVHLDMSNVKATDVSLKNLVSGCTKLKSIKMKMCLHVTDQGVTNVLSGSPDLEQIDLTDLHTITGQCFQCAGERIKSLVLNNCYKMREASMEILTKRCKHIEELYLTNCHELGSAAIRAISRNFEDLKCLHFNGIGRQVDPDALEYLSRLKKLEVLDVSQCQSVDSYVLTAISQGCKKLRDLNISSCNNVTDAGISALCQLPHFETLDVSYLNKVDGQTIVQLAMEGHIKKLVARATKFLTDEDVVSIASLSPNLQHLDLSGCFHISNKIFEGFTDSPVDATFTVQLFLGGTSVDWIGQDVDWMSGFSHLQVHMHNLAMDDLRPDRDLILPSYEDELTEEEDEQLRNLNLGLPPQYFAGFDDNCWEEDDYDGHSFDDAEAFLDNDDPLAAEQWEMS